MASPHYGERWGRHWLDVARYADSVNDSVNAGQRYPWSYTYRDWVISALNADMPYDQFVLYQLAADRVPNAEKKHLAALGFIRLGREFPKSQPETVDDRIDASTRGLLGLTVACARCHDHKYDPIPTKDYYSLYSIFSNLREPEELPVLGQAAETTVYEARLRSIRAAQEEYRQRRHAEMVALRDAPVACALQRVQRIERARRDARCAQADEEGIGGAYRADRVVQEAPAGDYRRAFGRKQRDGIQHFFRGGIEHRQLVCDA